MKKGTVTLECSCGNSKAWSVIGEMVAIESGRFKTKYKYSMECGECGARKVLSIREKA